MCVCVFNLTSPQGSAFLILLGVSLFPCCGRKYCQMPAWLCLLSSTLWSPVADASPGPETTGMRHARWCPPVLFVFKPLDISTINPILDLLPNLASKPGYLCKISKSKASVRKELPGASLFSNRRLLGLRRRCGSQVSAHGTHT